ncbi:MAG: cytochrome P460 family protein [Gemmatimonadales bacterium]|nr:cytochrome P460 family protein [Gemmatimonadales bacterium]
MAGACAPSDTPPQLSEGGAAAALAMAKPTFTATGELQRPEGYREWVYIGTPLTPNELNPPEAPFPEFHNVYIHPADYAHWKNTGEFQDGTVIVKELVTVGSKQAVSGNGYFMGEFVGLETTIKDAQRFADEPGNWAYFSFGHAYPLAETAPALPTASCNTCHDASADDDWVFTQYYPVLSASKGGTGTTADAADAAPTQQVSTAAAQALTGDDDVPTSADALFEYLQAGKYTSFAREAEAHKSVGPHPSPDLVAKSTVRAYFNGPMDASLKAGNATHPKGSAIVKEFYDDNDQLSGWAVAVKAEDDSQNGQGWYWYEVLSTTDGSSPVAADKGVALCWGCHLTGRDFVLSSYP